ncbi:hypothetical protein EfmAA242_26860 [Enterococcus faecium]|nr:hypothetical protein EfmAA242_26860 [Enterococcus faecium]
MEQFQGSAKMKKNAKQIVHVIRSNQTESIQQRVRLVLRQLGLSIGK